MSEYKRLTDSKTAKAMKENGNTTNPYYIYLAELEDKIEAGKLVELPCLMESPYEEDVILVYLHTEDEKAIKCETFFTREAAEARLKELEGKGK